MSLSGLILRMMGWKVTVTVPDFPRTIICVAPHTSNVDFTLCKLAYASIGRSAGFLMKASWFVWPLGPIFRAMGGIPVDRSKHTSLTDALVEKFRTTPHLHLAITPEGTRKRNCRWKTGFLRVAREVGVPISLAVLDYGKKEISMTEVFEPTGNMEADMHAIKQYYSQFTAKFPNQFCTADSDE